MTKGSVISVVQDKSIIAEKVAEFCGDNYTKLGEKEQLAENFTRP